MKNLKLSILLSLLVAAFTSCASQNQVAQTETTADRGPASVTASGVNWAQKYREHTMVNVVTVNRYPASEDGMKEMSKAQDAVTVVSQVYRSPGEKMQHGMLLFTVKKHPEVSGQIVGNSGSAGLSSRFTNIVAKIQTEGPNAKAAAVINETQAKMNELVRVSRAQRPDAIKKVLFEAREQLLAAY